MQKEEPFSAPDQAYNNRALVSILRQIHDELDTAVFAAYGWSENLTEGEILERLVDLNLERAEEEKNGLIRWLRPDYQAPDQITTQKEIEGIEIEDVIPTTTVELQKFPTTFKEQLTAIRELLRTQNREWTIEQIDSQFSGRKKIKNIANCLEILEELGLIISYEESSKKSYYAAELQQN
jgi:hypothetical protein